MYNKICIIGGSGSGKTTLSRNLGKLLDIPVYNIDGINYWKDWKTRDKKERDSIILDKMNATKWIMDGTYSSTLDARMNASDLVIFLDYSSLARFYGVLKRFMKNHGKEKDEIPGCREKMDIDFIRILLKWKNKRVSIIEKLSKVNNEKIIIFKNRKQLNEWYKKQFNTNIEI